MHFKGCFCKEFSFLSNGNIKQLLLFKFFSIANLLEKPHFPCEPHCDLNTCLHYSNTHCQLITSMLLFAFIISKWSAANDWDWNHYQMCARASVSLLRWISIEIRKFKDEFGSQYANVCLILIIEKWLNEKAYSKWILLCVVGIVCSNSQELNSRNFQLFDFTGTHWWRTKFPPLSILTHSVPIKSNVFD